MKIYRFVYVLAKPISIHSRKRYRVMTNYSKAYQHSIEQPEEFWKEQARRIDWYTFPDTILSEDEQGFYRWFKGGKLNTAYLALDYHVENGRGRSGGLDL